MKRKVSVICALAALVLVLALSGCSASASGFSVSAVQPSGDAPQNISLVLGAHEYFPAFNLQSDEIRQSVYSACYTYGRISAVCVDGDPYMICNYSVSAPDKNINEAKRRQLAEDNTARILSSIAGSAAKTEETDALRAVTLAAKTIQAVKGDCEKQMIVIDSGLCTCGLLDMTRQDVLNASAEGIAAQLEKLHALPDLTGVHVTWIGLGQSVGAQKRIPESGQYKLQTLWETILEASGAQIEFDSTQLSSVSWEGRLPKCSVIPVVTDAIRLEAVEEPEAVVYKLDERTSVRFKGDLAVFVDPEAARTDLTQLAGRLANCGGTYYVVGMTASVGSVEKVNALSEERALAVKQVLVELGVDPDRLRCIGLGYTPNVLRVNDRNEDGSLIEEEAAKNRAVFLIPEGNELIPGLLCLSRGEVSE